MKLENCTKIYDYLLEQDGAGVSVATIANELQMAPAEVEACLNTLNSSFIKVNGTDSYTVNRAEGFDQASMVKEFEEKCATKNMSLFWYMIFFTIGISLMTVFTATTNT